jgi:ABC-type transport system substrate-binding protein
MIMRREMKRKRFGFVLLLLLFSACNSQSVPKRDFIHISVPYEFESLDPHIRNTFSNLTILSHFYEPLVTTDKDMKIVPSLASFWETPDPHTWIFHLRKGVKFHSGKPLDAEDVVYTFERLMKSDNLGISGYLFSITSVEALNPFTIRLRTKRPASIMLNKIRLILIVPRGVTDQTLAIQEDATGPYVLTYWNKGLSVEMTIND